VTTPRSKWFTKRALLAHLALVVWVPGCAVAAWWQVTVALGGNKLAYLYSVEWPVFALMGGVAWWNFVHDDPERVGKAALRRAVAEAPEEPPLAPPPDADGDEELAEYNAYLAELAKSGRKTWRRH
jgi:hypothetical protein